jgi:hypothetical protein
MAMHESADAVFSPVDVRDAEIVPHNRTSVDRDGLMLVADRVRQVAADVGSDEVPLYRRTSCPVGRRLKSSQAVTMPSQLKLS